MTSIYARNTYPFFHRGPHLHHSRPTEDGQTTITQNMGGDNFSVTFGPGLAVQSITPTNSFMTPPPTYASPITSPIQSLVSTDTTCPVCLTPATPHDAVQTPCGHTYCRRCLQSYFSTAQRTRSFPLACVYSSTVSGSWPCSAAFSIPFLRRTLNSSPSHNPYSRHNNNNSNSNNNPTLAALLNSSFTAYVQSRPQLYTPCPTPDCPTIHRTSSSATCRRCLATAPPVTAAFNAWCEDEKVQPCPGCHAPIQLAEGCPHVCCTICGTHMCFSCTPPRRFASSAEVYAHVRVAHPDSNDERRRREEEERRNQELFMQWMRREGMA